MQTIKRPLKVTSESEDNMGTLVFELLHSSTLTHLLHLVVTGSGSFAAHKALNTYYDEVIGLADDLAEQYQGLSEKLLIFPDKSEFSQAKSVADGIAYLRNLYKMAAEYQENCPYSEINNGIDEVKTLINATKYKLTFLK